MSTDPYIRVGISTTEVAQRAARPFRYRTPAPLPGGPEEGTRAAAGLRGTNHPTEKKSNRYDLPTHATAYGRVHRAESYMSQMWRGNLGAPRGGATTLRLDIRRDSPVSAQFSASRNGYKV